MAVIQVELSKEPSQKSTLQLASIHTQSSQSTSLPLSPICVCRPSSRASHGPSMVVAAPPPPTSTSSPEDEDPPPLSGFDYGAPPPFTLADIRNAIPKQCWEKNTWRSMSFLARDVLMVFGLAAAAFAVNSWTLWPLYWLAQGTMFWALFVVGHDW
jgi:omega-3 fatty acid desaturase (delta-15 desaturase)